MLCTRSKRKIVLYEKVTYGKYHVTIGKMRKIFYNVLFKTALWKRSHSKIYMNPQELLLDRNMQAIIRSEPSYSLLLLLKTEM